MQENVMKLNDKVSWLVGRVKKVYSSGLVLLLEIDQNIQIDAIFNLEGIVCVFTTGKIEKMPQYRHRLLQPVVGVAEEGVPVAVTASGRLKNSPHRL
jgi:hypothetical protein